jgi:hypothetical protein
MDATLAYEVARLLEAGGRVPEARRARPFDEGEQGTLVEAFVLEVTRSETPS